MLAFLSAHWVTIALSLITAGALAFCRFMWKQVKNYRKLLNDQEATELDNKIDQKLEPIVAEIEDLREYIRKTENNEQYQINLIIGSYKYRLVQLCRLYLKQGYMTGEQYEQLTEFYKLYHELGGNGQAQDFYEKVCELEVKD